MRSDWYKSKDVQQRKPKQDIKHNALLEAEEERRNMDSSLDTNRAIMKRLESCTKALHAIRDHSGKKGITWHIANKCIEENLL